MNHLFQATVYTTQQLVLEALQRWLQRPCEPEQQRARRTGLKGLLVLLLKTAATGVLATILDAAIEYRRRQLLSAAEEPTTSGSGSGEDDRGLTSRLTSLSLGPLSRAGIAAWKARLLLAIDELERQAGNFGIEPTHRFTPAKPEDGEGKAERDEGEPEVGSREARQAALAKTIEQLQDLMKQGGGGDNVDEAIDEGVDMLLNSLLSAEGPLDLSVDAGSSSAVNLDKWRSITSSPGISEMSCSTASFSSREELAVDCADHLDASGQIMDCMMSWQPRNCPRSSSMEQLPTCSICMDRAVKVQVLGCAHDLCFHCARRLCSTGDHSVPQCPFCRQPIDGFAATTSMSGMEGALMAAESAT